jgi:dCTP deaminase
MSFWSTEKFAASAKEIVEPCDEKHLKHGAYELAVGPEAFITSSEVKQTLEERQQISIHPGQFGLLITEEIVHIPTTAIAFISIRASIKFQGLINVSGFHVDPGFTGRLKFAVYNAGSRNITLERGERIFMIWLSDLDRQTLDPYQGKRGGQMGIAADDVRQLQGDIASPAALKQQLKELETSVEKKFTSLDKEYTFLRAVGLALLLAMLGPCLRDTVLSMRDTKSNSGSVPPSSSHSVIPTVPIGRTLDSSGTPAASPIEPSRARQP